MRIMVLTEVELNDTHLSRFAQAEGASLAAVVADAAAQIPAVIKTTLERCDAVSQAESRVWHESARMSSPPRRRPQSPRSPPPRQADVCHPAADSRSDNG
jgi:hypothetical protein